MKTQVESLKAYIDLGIDEIDRQHQRLLVLMDRLYEAADRKSDISVARGVAHDLFDYFDEHFAREEALMELAGYGRLEAHKREHDGIIAKITDFFAGPDFNAMDFHWMLYQWLVHHILNSDRDYVATVRAWLDRKAEGGTSEVANG